MRGCIGIYIQKYPVDKHQLPYSFAEAFQDKISGPFAKKPWHQGPYDLLAVNGNMNSDIVLAAWEILK